MAALLLSTEKRKQIYCNQLKTTSDRLQSTNQLDCNPVVLGPEPVDLVPNPMILVPNPVVLVPNPVVLGPNPVNLRPNPVVLGHNPVDLGPNLVGQYPGVELCGRILAKNPKLADLTETRRVCHTV